MKRSSMFITVVYAITMLVVPAFSSTVPAGTQLSVRITENLSSANAKVGQAFHGTLEAPITGNGRMTFPKGSQVTGKVVGVHASGRLSDPGVLDLKLVSISDGRSSSALDTQVFHIKGESHTKSNAAKIGGTAAAGTILGAIFGGGKGALIGAGAGAAAGTVAAAATGKKEAKVESEAVLPFVTAGAPAVALAQPPPPVQSVQAPPAPPPPVQEVQADYPEDNQPAYNRRDRDDADDDGEDDRYRREDRDRDDDRYQRDDRYAQSGYDQGRYVQGFSDHDRRTIRGCYSQNYSNLPPGLAKRDGNLPPGLERHLQRDGTLPPGLQRRVRLLPRSCERRLPPVPKGWVRGVLSGRIMLLDAHYRIMDLFVLRGDD